MAKLGINGKVVDITNIANKTKAQFKAQLKQAGVVLDEERLEKVYTQLHDSAVEKEKIKDMTPEAKRTYLSQKYPEHFADIARMREEAKAKAMANVKH